MGLSNNQSVLGKHGLIKGAILLENRARSKQREITKDQIPSAINISNPGTTSIHIIDKITDFPPNNTNLACFPQARYHLPLLFLLHYIYYYCRNYLLEYQETLGKNVLRLNNKQNCHTPFLLL